MMRATLAAAALPLFLSATALAQTAATQPPKNCPAPGTVAESAMPPECKQQGTTGNVRTPSTNNSAATAPATTTPSTTTSTTTTATPSEPTTTGSITPAAVPPANGVLASEFMGQTVYNVSGDSIGKISDLVMTKNLDNILAIIGVGGFLGLGEKDVAIPISQIKVDKDVNQNLKLTINNTKAQLEAAPTFDRTALK